MIWTFTDLIEHLQDVHEFEFDTRAHRNARRAILRAYRDLPNFHSWSYYCNRRRTLLTVAPQTEGTVEYTHATREVTLTDATWPADVIKYRLILGGTHFEVFSRTSDTVIVLPFENNPGADVASGASYTLYKEAYPLPIGFRKMVQLYDVQQKCEVRCVQAGNQHRLAIQAWDTPSVPVVYAIRGGDDFLGGMTVVFAPAPSEVRQYDMAIDVDPQPLRLEKLSGSDAITAANSPTVTFDTSVIPDIAVGSVLRLSSTSDPPTSLVGAAASDGTDDTNPAVFERIILDRVSANEVTLDAQIPDTMTNVGFVISDPLDVEPSSMLTVLQRLAEAEYAKLQKIGEPAQRASYWQTFRETLLDAKASDRREVRFNGRGPELYDPFRRTQLSTI